MKYYELSPAKKATMWNKLHSGIRGQGFNNMSIVFFRPPILLHQWVWFGHVWFLPLEKRSVQCPGGPTLSQARSFRSRPARGGALAQGSAVDRRMELPAVVPRGAADLFWDAELNFLDLFKVIFYFPLLTNHHFGIIFLFFQVPEAKWTFGRLNGPHWTGQKMFDC